MIDWDAVWEEYRTWHEDAEESILTMHAPSEGVPLSSITFAAEVIELTRRWGGQIETNGEVTWPPASPESIAAIRIVNSAPFACGNVRFSSASTLAHGPFAERSDVSPMIMSASIDHDSLPRPQPTTS